MLKHGATFKEFQRSPIGPAQAVVHQGGNFAEGIDRQEGVLPLLTGTEIEAYLATKCGLAS